MISGFLDLNLLLESKGDFFDNFLSRQSLIVNKLCQKIITTNIKIVPKSAKSKQI